MSSPSPHLTTSSARLRWCTCASDESVGRESDVYRRGAACVRSYRLARRKKVALVCRLSAGGGCVFSVLYAKLFTVSAWASSKQSRIHLGRLPFSTESPVFHRPGAGRAGGRGAWREGERDETPPGIDRRPVGYSARDSENELRGGKRPKATLNSFSESRGVTLAFGL